MEFRAASRLPQAPAREGRKPVVCRTHNIWEPLPRLPENRGKPRTRGAGVLSLSAYATIWHRPLVPANRARLKSTVARQAFKLRAEKVERSFALILDIGGLRRTWLRGAGNVEKRYLIQVAAHNLGLVIRHRFGAGTPRQAAALFGLVSDECQGRGLAIWTILVPSCADQRTTAGVSPVVLIYLLVFSI